MYAPIVLLILFVHSSLQLIQLFVYSVSLSYRFFGSHGDRATTRIITPVSRSTDRDIARPRFEANRGAEEVAVRALGRKERADNGGPNRELW